MATDHLFINHVCSFLDKGGITIEDDVMIGRRVNLTSGNHSLSPGDQTRVLLQPIVIKRNAWIGATATTLPGLDVQFSVTEQLVGHTDTVLLAFHHPV